MSGPASTGVNPDRNSEDCTPCKVIGGTAFIGLGFYTLYEGRKQLRGEVEKAIASKRAVSRLSYGARLTGVYGIGVALVGGGFYRILS